MLITRKDGSDLYLSTGAQPSAKFYGKLKPIQKEVLQPGEVEKMAYALMDEAQIEIFETEFEMNLAISESGIGRFRVNIFKQRNQTSMVVRNIKTEIPNFKELGLPSVLSKIIMEKRGLILYTGATGSGKSTSLTAMIDYRNTHSGGHIVTIEDPIEFIHTHKKSIINQREIGVDTLSYEAALKNTLRQAPDVIFIGEIRDKETMEHALAFAETGHLAISTLHANNANQALDRILNFFPEKKHPQLLQDLSLNLRAFVSQRLIPTIDGKRTAAIEILIGNSTTQEYISQGKIAGLKEIMEKSETIGMQTFDSALFKLYQQGKISEKQALKNADSPNNVRLKINLNKKAPVITSKQEKSTSTLSPELKSAMLDLNLDVDSLLDSSPQSGEVDIDLSLGLNLDSLKLTA